MEKIFVVAPHFPPSAMPPAQRVRLMVTHLFKFDLYPVVFTVDHKFREELTDDWMVQLAGTNYTLVKVKCLDQRLTRKISLGDLGLRMLPFLFRSLLTQSKQQKPAFILYPVPPWYIMLVAPALKKITGIKYGLDFIDPWVHQQKKGGAKSRISQWIARRFEGYVVRNADLIIAVSEGILSDIRQRHPVSVAIPMLALPYGVEPGDYSRKIQPDSVNDRISIRYIGAVSEAMIPVASIVVSALRELANNINIKAEFIGTSYAGAGLATNRLGSIATEPDKVWLEELPDRVSYKQAVDLMANSDLLLLFGDTTHYYAASKLLGLIASARPFVAFVHEKSFPASFLAGYDYPYLITYGDGIESIRGEHERLKNVIRKAIDERHSFTPMDPNSTAFEEHTAFGMARNLANKINYLINAN